MTTVIFYLALNAYHEARGEPDDGIKAVCKVVLNRAHNRQQSVKKVIYSPFQFSWTGDDIPDAPLNQKRFADMVALSEEALLEWVNGDTLNKADHYFANYIEPPPWSKKMHRVCQIGKHIFYRS